MRVKNVNDIFDSLLKIEEDLKLFEKQIDGIFFWRLIRLRVYNTLISFLKKPVQNTINKKKIRNRFHVLVNIFKNSLFNSVYNDPTKVDVLFFENPRKLHNEFNNYYDPYTYYYIEKFKTNSDLKYQIIENGYLGKHFQKVNDTRKYSESINYDLIYKIYLNLFFKINDSEIVFELEQKIYEYLRVKMDMKNILLDTMKMFKYQNVKYGKIFDIKQPKEIYLVCSYGKEGMINAAKERNIKVIEFQHGVMGEFHLGYSFPKNTEVAYFPDKLILFGKYWQDCTALPIRDVEYFGFPHLKSMIAKSQRKERDDHKILIISQLSHELFNYSLRLAQENPSFKFIFKLHPKEKNNWKDIYPILENNGVENFIVEDSDDLHRLIATSKFLVAVSSFVVYESLIDDIITIVLDISNDGQINQLVKNKNVIKVAIDQPINFMKLKFECIKPLDKNYFFHGYDKV